MIILDSIQILRSNIQSCARIIQIPYSIEYMIHEWNALRLHKQKHAELD